MFPVMLLGPSLSGIFLTWIIGGKTGLHDLFSKMLRARVRARWYVPLLLPPVLILTLLSHLKTFLSPAYTPNLFLMGVLFGVPAGLLEEIGWTGFAFPKMSSQHNALGASILLGLLWGSMALTGRQLPRNRYAPRSILVPIFPGVQLSP